jgi:hypothetical protein
MGLPRTLEVDEFGTGGIAVVVQPVGAAPARHILIRRHVTTS